MQKEQGPVGSLGASRKVHIIGAGISGLLMGYYLKKSGREVLIFEGSSIGGKISTKTTPSGLAETAANAIFTNEDVMELLKELRLSWVPSSKKLKKKIWRYGKARSFPLMPWEIARLLLGLFKKPPQNPERLSVMEFFRPLMGERPAFEVLSAVLGGIYASNSRQLHFKSVFKTEIQAKTYFGWIRGLIKARKASGHRAISISFEGGMQSFIDALREQLKENIVQEFKKETDPAVNTVICADSIDAAEIVESQRPEVSRFLKEIDYRSLATGTYFFKKPSQELENSFGVLFPPGSGFECLGVLHNTAIFPGRSATEGLKSYTFISMEENFNPSRAAAQLRKLDNQPFSADMAADHSQTYWKRGIPIYNSKRFEAIKKLRTLMRESGPGLVLFGNYVDGISIREMVTGAKKFAAEN